MTFTSSSLNSANSRVAKINTETNTVVDRTKILSPPGAFTVSQTWDVQCKLYGACTDAMSIPSLDESAYTPRSLNDSVRRSRTRSAYGITNTASPPNPNA